MIDVAKRRKLGSTLELAEVLEHEWRPSIQPYTSVDLQSEARRSMQRSGKRPMKTGASVEFDELA